MKIKSLLLPAFLFINILSFGQIQKGAVMVGGNISYSTNKSESTDSKSHSFNISPGAGIAVKDNLILGVDILYGSSLDQGQLTRRETNGFGAGVFMRKYAVIAKNFYLFGQGRIGTSFYDEEHKNGNIVQEFKTTYINLSAYPGVAYSITPKLMLEAGFPDLLYAGYSSRKATGTPNDKSTSFGVATSLSSGTPLSIGMRVLLNRR